MKLVVAALALFGSIASAQTVNITFPDFDMQPAFEKSEIKQDAAVLAYVAQLGGGKIAVVGAGELQAYTVKTSKGCQFSVQYVYGKPYLSKNRVDKVVIAYDAICI